MQGLTLGQAAKRLDVSVARVLQLVTQGRIPYTQTPLGRLYDPVTVEQLRRERMQRLERRMEVSHAN
jgi:excisionase family DNA binding protein